MQKIFLILTVFLLHSCAEKPETQAAADTQKTVTKDNVFSAQQEALQRAKDMEKQVLEAAEKQKKAIDDLNE